MAKSRSARILKTPADVADYLGASSENDDGTPMTLEQLNKGIEHRVYEDTSCGAWALVAPCSIVSRRERKVKWNALLRTENGALLVSQARPEHGRSLKPDDLPKAVRFWLNMVDGSSAISVPTHETPDGFIETCRNCGTRIESLGVGRWRIYFELEMPARSREGFAFLCNSIVEGSDAEVNAGRVLLPCKAEDIDKTLEYVEGECDRIWRGTHGCEKCGLDGAINEDCPECHGEGVIL